MRDWWLVSYVVLWFFVILLAFLCLAILRQFGLVYVRLGGSLGALQTSDGPRIGDPIPVTEAADSSGIVRPLVPVAKPLNLLLFMSPTCELCDPLIATLPSFARSVRREADTVVILSGVDRTGKLDGWRSDRLPLIEEPMISDLFALPATPYGLVVDRDGRVVSKGVVNDVVQIESLINEADSHMLRESEEVAVTNDHQGRTP